jgi:hypothetical protein
LAQSEQQDFSLRMATSLPLAGNTCRVCLPIPLRKSSIRVQKNNYFPGFLFFNPYFLIFAAENGAHDSIHRIGLNRESRENREQYPLLLAL